MFRFMTKNSTIPPSCLKIEVHFFQKLFKTVKGQKVHEEVVVEFLAINLNISEIKN